MKVKVLDVNDNSPEIVDPQGDVVSVREEQPTGTEVARVRALDTDLGENASVTYSILKGKGYITVNITLIYFGHICVRLDIMEREKERSHLDYLLIAVRD